MNDKTADAVRRVLKAAGRQTHFFDLSDGQRLAWMIECAYRLGHKDAKRSGLRITSQRKR